MTLDPILKEKADELHINYSEAFEKGLKIMLTLNDDEYKKKMRIAEQKNKVKKLKAQMKFGEDLFKAINEIKFEYSEIMVTGSNISDNEYIIELIKLKAMELDISPKALEHLFNNMILGKTTEAEIEGFKKEDISLFIDK